ncbi:glycosyltransferase family 9 protein [Motiliproteus sediminis]|uniref:glycosyltransferase family 9 protein n=1 Tax=Motiliproteus sediminis TaxID=1468178 RepID=UPI001AEF5CAA|nr:glycosyltransferase family 9 protein [Motiliproteus sediminis]
MSVDLPLREPPQSICVLRLSALGDVCNAVPAIRALQRQWPDCRITWIIGKVERMLLDGLEGVEFITYDKSSGLKGVLALRQQLAGRRFDILLHMQAALRASLVSLAIPARIRLGFDRERAKDRQYLFTNARIAAQPHSHVLEGFQGFVRALGADPQPLEWNIPIPDADRTRAKERAPEGRYLVISPCSSQRIRNFRNWSAGGYAAVIDYAYQNYGVYTVLTGGNSELEQQYGTDISRLAQSPVTNLIGQTTLKELLALIGNAAGVIGPDSGPMHMATTTRTPALGLYASSNPDRTGPYLSRDWVINRYPDQVRKAFDADVSEVSWGKRVRDPDVMDSIKVDEVIAMVDRLLGEGNPA